MKNNDSDSTTHPVCRGVVNTRIIADAV